MRKPDFCICENKGADQSRGNCETDQRLRFRYSDSTVPLLNIAKNFKPLACFSDCTGRFMLHLVDNPEDRFSRVTAHFKFEFWVLVVAIADPLPLNYIIIHVKSKGVKVPKSYILAHKNP